MTTTPIIFTAGRITAALCAAIDTAALDTGRTVARGIDRLTAAGWTIDSISLGAWKDEASIDDRARGWLKRRRTRMVVIIAGAPDGRGAAITIIQTRAAQWTTKWGDGHRGGARYLTEAQAGGGYVYAKAWLTPAEQEAA